MKLLGIDFTSTPGPRKPIALARARLAGARLTIESVRPIVDWPAFESALGEPGPWVAGLDFPFGLPDTLVDGWAERHGWPRGWAGTVRRAGAMAPAEWRAWMRADAARRPPGSKYLFRLADRLAGSASPMNVINPPVGMMFQAGAPRLLAAAERHGFQIPPHRKRGDGERVALEIYPRLVADALIGRVPYKGKPSTRSRTGAQVAAERRRRQQQRTRMVAVLAGAGEPVLARALRAAYGVSVRLAGGAAGKLARTLVADEEGDLLDAALSTLDAAWAHRLRNDPRTPYGIPPGFSREGWIVDPANLAGWRDARRR